MQLKEHQIKLFRQVLSKEDKQYIADKSKMSYRTVEAVLNGDRSNPEIETNIIRRCNSISLLLIDTLKEIEISYIKPVELSEYQAFKNKLGSDDSDIHKLYTDVYLQLSHQVYEINELWDILHNNHKVLITNVFYCILLLQRLCGLTDTITVSFYNSKAIY